MPRKKLFINAVGMVEFGGGESIPTVLRYQSDQPPLIGAEALMYLDDPEGINEDFKIDIGKVKPGQAVTTRAHFLCGDDIRRSANHLTKDFLDQMVDRTREYLAKQDMDLAKHVLVSEPLSFHASSDTGWIENYRGNIRRILGASFEGIEFIPEPFAVYQYYRYGVRHSLVAQERKHCALVIDFGGGTFDASVVETTQIGDISKSGKHARPLGAHSKAVGGFEVNRQFAKALLNSTYAQALDKEKLKKGFENYYRWRDNELEIETLNFPNQTFLRWLGKFLRQVETTKISLAKQITDWRLDVGLPGIVRLDVPENPFSIDSNVIPLRVSAEMMRDIFVNEIWNRRLKGCVRSALSHAKKELNGRPLDIVLLSGGSANLRWLETLVLRDFLDELSSAHIVSLRESYQEVVAKGLAIECARRGFEPNSEFTDVTYNPLFLVLNPDNTTEQIKRFRLLDGPSGVRKPTVDGELLASAESLDINDEQELAWKVRLDRPPKHHLEYFFIRGSTDINDIENRYNVVQERLATPAGIHFDSAIKVKLKIREDGTCTPTFVYHSDRGGQPADVVTGCPFCIDLVSANQRASRDAYIGVDFGTSTSGISYVDWKQIEIFESRGRQEIWLNLNELIDLPTPVAVPLKALLGSTRIEDQWRLSMDALEAFLCFSAFVCWAEAGAADNASMPKCFNPNWKRSAGPLKKLLTDLVDSKAQGNFLGVFRKKLTKDIRNELNRVIQQLDDEKHQKQAPGTCDAKPLLEKLGNICKEASTGWVFGYFEDVRQSGFQQKFQGTLRVASGTPPFHQAIAFSGPSSFSENQAIFANPANGDVLIMTPLMFWHRPSPIATWQNCMVFDGIDRNNRINFKRVGVTECLSIEGAGEYGDLELLVRELCEGRSRAVRISGCEFVVDQDSDL